MIGNIDSLIIAAVWAAIAGIAVAAVLSVRNRFFRAANSALLLSSIFGSLAAVAFLLNHSGQELVLAQVNWFFGLSFNLGFLSAVFLLLICGLGGLAIFFSREYLWHYRETYDIRTVQLLTSFFLLGMIGVVLAGNTFGFMVFWELMSIASFFLVMADRSPESGRAAFVYFIMTHLGAGALLGGFLLLGQGQMSFELKDIPAAAAALPAGSQALVFVLFLFGFGSKAGLIPLHVWLPEAHPQAPTHISAMMSGLMLKVALYGFLITVVAFPVVPAWAAITVIIMGIASAFFGALYAVARRDIKRIFAFSSIENMGIIFTMLGMALYVRSHVEGADALALPLMAYALFHALNHAVFKTGLFLSSGLIIGRVHSRCLELMGGLAKAMPVFSFVFLIIILSAAALPPFGTFYGEWGFIHSLVDLLGFGQAPTFAKIIFLAILALFALVSGLAVFAMVKTYALSMLGLPRAKQDSGAEEGSERQMIYPLMIIAAATVLMGLFGRDILNGLVAHLGSGTQYPVASRTAAQISSISVFALFFAVASAAVIFYELFRKGALREREYHTWDCGQPINASMEYTATAFSGPMRFFFATFLRRHKHIVMEPLVATNPWMVRKKYFFDLPSIWKEKLYRPVAKTIYWLADKARLLHSGRIQYYLLMLLVTLVITIIICL